MIMCKEYLFICTMLITYIVYISICYVCVVHFYSPYEYMKSLNGNR